jgi:hypothetical protein
MAVTMSARFMMSLPKIVFGIEVGTASMAKPAGF